VIKPYFSAISSVIPKLDYAVQNCSDNASKFGELKEKYAKELESHNKDF